MNAPRFGQCINYKLKCSTNTQYSSSIVSTGILSNKLLRFRSQNVEGFWIYSCAKINKDIG